MRPLTGDIRELRFAGRCVALDAHGYLRDPLAWDEECAEALARRDHVAPLTEDHWKVLWFIRQHFLEFEAPPMVRMISRRTGLGLEQIEVLFRTRCRDCMCRIAGLPKPTG